MNISLPKELGNFVEAEVQRGAYASAREVIEDGLRTLIREKQSTLNIDQDTPELAEQIRQSLQNPRSPYVPGEFKKRLEDKLAKTNGGRR